MKNIILKYRDSACIDQAAIHKQADALHPFIMQMRAAVSKKYATPYGALYAPADTETINTIHAYAEQIRALNPSLLIVIGIGGSNLGTMAIIDALNGSYYNMLTRNLKILCADTIDQAYTSQLLAVAEQELKAGKRVILNIITKSGSTTETLVNGALFINLLRTYYDTKTVAESVIITTDAGSPLEAVAESHNYKIITIPTLIGGRYSVFSAVGLFPLALIGINIHDLCAGAVSMRDHCMSTDITHNISLVSALIIYNHMQQNITIIDSFVCTPRLATWGAWYRQLVGESLGKKYNLNGDCVETGITPTTSVGSTDLHSVAQLYLGGPRDKITVFISLADNNSTSTSLKVPSDFIPELFNFLEHKTINRISHDILAGVTAAYEAENRPFMQVIMPELNDFYLGQIMMFKIIEIIYIGYLLSINVFDQPAVELYKHETRRLLQP
jgi:glucose-6-phosphate isomerase